MSFAVYVGKDPLQHRPSSGRPHGSRIQDSGAQYATRLTSIVERAPALFAQAMMA
jgi:hypothetical protein